MSKIVFLNGAFVPESKAVVPIQDRGFLYGDGLFETLRIQHGRLFRWSAHWQRLQRGLELLRLPLQQDEAALRQAAQQVIEANRTAVGALRITISRGVGPRGYSPKGAHQPTLAMMVFDAPASAATHPLQWRVCLSRHRLPPSSPLSECKTANKLLQVLARMEADDAGVDETLLVDDQGFLAEATCGNLFWLREGYVEHPPEEAGALPGVSASIIQELCATLGIQTREHRLRPEDLVQTQGAFLTFTTQGVVELIQCGQNALSRSPHVAELWAAYRRLVETETSAAP